MSYVVYDLDSTKITLRPKNHDYFETTSAAAAAITRATKKGKDTSNWRVAETKVFFDSIEKKEVRRGIVHAAGKEFYVGVNTPWTSGPWSETYWCS